MTNLAEMERELAALTERVTSERARVKSDTLLAISAMLASGTLSADDLRALLPKSSATPRKRDRSGRKLPPKYRNPATGDTWSGQGAIPLWLRDKTMVEREAYLIPTDAQ